MPHGSGDRSIAKGIEGSAMDLPNINLGQHTSPNRPKMDISLDREKPNVSKPCGWVNKTVHHVQEEDPLPHAGSVQQNVHVAHIIYHHLSLQRDRED